MSQDTKQAQTDSAQPEIKSKALEDLLKKAILSVPGTLKHSNGVEFITRRPYPRVSADKTGKRKDGNPEFKITADIAVYWPNPATNIAEMCQKTLTEWAQLYTGAYISECTVNVSTFVADKKDEHSVSVADINATPKAEIAQDSHQDSSNQKRGLLKQNKKPAAQPVEVSQSPESTELKADKKPEAKVVDQKQYDELIDPDTEKSAPKGKTSGTKATTNSDEKTSEGEADGKE